MKLPSDILRSIAKDPGWIRDDNIELFRFGRDEIRLNTLYTRRDDKPYSYRSPLEEPTINDTYVDAVLKYGGFFHKKYMLINIIHSMEGPIAKYRIFKDKNDAVDLFKRIGANVLI